jgi:hypothetical protein
MGKMPVQKPGKSRQDYQTPPEFIEAVQRRFGALTWDLAASAENTVVPGRFFSRGGIDAAKADWTDYLGPRDLCWLNPPFGAISHVWAPLLSHWCPRIPGMRVLFFVPAAIGSEWYRAHVHGRAMTLGLGPRVTFVGEVHPYPKDLMLCAFGFGVAGFDLWRWQAKRERSAPIVTAGAEVA